MFNTCNKCGKTYSTKECGCTKTKDTNPHKCSLCGAFASVYPFAHRPTQYVIKELNDPTKMYCAECFYDLVAKDHKVQTKQKKECPF